MGAGGHGDSPLLRWGQAEVFITSRAKYTWRSTNRAGAIEQRQRHSASLGPRFVDFHFESRWIAVGAGPYGLLERNGLETTRSRATRHRRTTAALPRPNQGVGRACPPESQRETFANHGADPAAGSDLYVSDPVRPDSKGTKCSTDGNVRWGGR